MTEAVRIGLIGCGVISNAYLRASETFPILQFVACADINPDASARCEDRYGIPALSVDELLANDEVEAVLNLTVPRAHVDVNLAALEADKHAYCEKPFGLDVKSGKRVLELAADKGLRVGCAPDTFLGGGHQTVRKLIDDGEIGQPLAGTAFMMSHGVESWHPAPEFYYEPGGGPLFDMGPYYISALVNTLGPVKRVTAITGRGFAQRTITSQPRAGKVVDVEIDTHASGVLEFANGAIVSVSMSFDVWAHTNHNIELHGSEASLGVPDPNGFGGRVRRATSGREWVDCELTHGYTGNMRSIGLADMCTGIREARPHRASGEFAFHVLEVMDAFGRSSSSGSHVAIETQPARPEPLAEGLSEGEIK